MQTRFQRELRRGDVSRQRRGVQHRLGLGLGDRLLQRLEAAIGRCPGLGLERVEGVGVLVDIGHDLDLWGVRQDLSSPAPTMLSETDLE